METQIKNPSKLTFRSIAEIVFKASQSQIRLFLEWFRMGDGQLTKDGREFFYTSSPKMKDQLQHLLLMVGKKSSISTREPRDSMINGRMILKELPTPSLL